MGDSWIGQTLIAMPSLGDPRFERAVVYICAHSNEGSMGVIVNKPTPHITFPDLLAQLGMDADPDRARTPVHFGGPVEMTRGFILHSCDYQAEEGTVPVAGDICLTSSLAALDDLARGTGPEHALFALGYAGWAAGQLADEIANNDWLIAPTHPDIIFTAPDAQKWSEALDVIGVNPMMLSSTGGRA